MIAAVWADEATVAQFRSWGVTDSKKLSDGRVRDLARQIMGSQIPYEVISIGPEKYNELHAKMRNLNRLLAWGHARAIENVLGKAEAGLAVADQFGDESLIKNALMQRGREIELFQMHRGESEPAVAAASILARAGFLKGLAALGEKIGVTLPKGAGPPVDKAGVQVLRRGGMALLRTVAKCHFKNTQKVEKLMIA